MSSQTPRRTFLNRTVIGAFFAGVIATVGLTAVAATEALGGVQRTAMIVHAGASDPATHVQMMLAMLYKTVNATDAQKAQIDPLVQQAVTDLTPLHQQLSAGHHQLAALLTADIIDRNALETLRAQQMQTIDQMSKRLSLLAGDVGTVLTPAQRVQLQQHLSALHDKMHQAAIKQN
ncbi:MAG: Spy/CpxP family protein refolding chaperone [Burkholderiales bacterium]|nr:Spy/CpxP family protein refolding chaperone [Burkholderiales bacterium]